MSQNHDSRWSRRRFLGASAAVGVLASTSTLLLSSGDSVPTSVWSEARLEFEQSRTRPGFTAAVNVELPRELHHLEVVDVVLLRGREDTSASHIDHALTSLRVPLFKGVGRAEFEVPGVELEACERDCEAASLTAAVFAAAGDRAVTISKDPLNVIVSPFFFGI